MIDTSQYIPFSEAGRHIPGNPSIATLHRWRLRGARGRKLETQLVGGRRFVSLSAIRKFINADPAPIGSEGDAVASELKRIGI